MEYIQQHLGNYSRSPPLTLVRHHHDDELQAITRSINEAKSRLEHAHSSLQQQTLNLEKQVRLREQAELSLRQHSEQLVTLLENLTDAVLTVNHQAELIEINASGAEFLAAPTDQATPLLRLPQLLEVYLEENRQAEPIDWKELLLLPMPQSLSCYGRKINSAATRLPLMVKIMRPLPEGPFVVAIQDQSKASQLEEISYNATHDYLTGAFNRYGFNLQLQQLLARLQTHPEQDYMLALLDLDHFKQVNDTSGHQAGDRLLQQVVKAIRQQLGADDILGRLGGDEFVILIKGPYALSMQRCRNFLLALENLDFQWDEQLLLISTSIGLTRIYPDDSDSELLARADLACYRVKHDGGGAIQFQVPANRAETRIRHDMDILQRVRSALKTEQLILYAQPIFSSRSNAPPRFEMLTRLQGKQDGCSIPIAFYPFLRHTPIRPSWTRRSSVKPAACYRACNPQTAGCMSTCRHAPCSNHSRCKPCLN
ncbi:MAG: diguanylate cyclase [Thiolinea sp.]